MRSSTLSVAFHYLAPTDALEAYAQELGRELDQCCNRITECRMTLQGPRYDRAVEVAYCAKIELCVPGAQIYADSECAGTGPAATIQEAMQQALDNAKRQLSRLPRFANAHRLPEFASSAD